MGNFYAVAAVVTTFKLLLMQSYKSTDFDVHRNWLAIMHSLPIREWYFEATSQWTLDYPPLFAWFEWFLSQLAVFVDPEMLKVENTDFANESTVIFQRLTVIVTDFVYIYAVKELYDFYKSFRKKTEEENEDIFYSPALVQSVVLLTNFGLLIVDHIHFQYNGFLYGILLLSIVRLYQGHHLSAAFWFAVLINLKHIYLYIAPAYFVYLLRSYVFQHKEDGSVKWTSFSLLRFLGLGLVVVSVFLVSFGPFILLGQVPQVLSRLFPFKRGLCHAYWAPNFWALYNMADKGLLVTASRLGITDAGHNHSASMTGGLVQEFDHIILPSISPVVTILLSLLAMLPCLAVLWLRPSGPQSFVRALILCAFSSFMFGWHVHEKAILMVIIPMSLLIVEKKNDAKLYIFLSTIGHYSLFPLFFTQFETPIKILLLCLTSVYTLNSLTHIYRDDSASWLPLLSRTECLYLLGILPLELYNSVIHHVLHVNTRLPFLPLMFTSVYCALGIFYSWLQFYQMFVQGTFKYCNHIQQKEQHKVN